VVLDVGQCAGDISYLLFGARSYRLVELDLWYRRGSWIRSIVVSGWRIR